MLMIASILVIICYNLFFQNCYILGFYTKVELIALRFDDVLELARIYHPGKGRPDTYINQRKCYPFRNYRVLNLTRRRTPPSN